MQIVPCDEKQIKVTKRFRTADEKTRGFQKEWVVLRCSSGYFFSKIAFGTGAKRLN